MNFISCLHPKTIVRHGEEFRVPCGKCDYCKYIRNISIAERLRLEIQNHKYCIFFTLKYADPFLPRILYSSNAKGFYVSDEDLYDTPVSQDSGLFVSWPFLEGRDRCFVDSCMTLRGFVPRVRKYDVQCFIKRLRINIKRKIFKNENYSKLQYLSYAVCGEYGPTSFRPHYHGLLFFDCKQIAEQFRSLLSESWPYGSSSFRYASEARSARYVANYIACTHKLPNFYSSKEICPFILLSKACPIGYSALSKEEVQKAFECSTPKITVFDREKGTNVDVPLWRSLENKLYPRCSQFNCLTDWQRIQLYRFVNKSRSTSELREMIRDIFQGFYFDFLKVPLCKSFLYDYFHELIRGDLLCDSSNILDLFPSPSVVYSPVISVINSLYYVVKRFYANLTKFGITEEEHFRRIDLYYKNKNQYLLSLQCEFQNDFMSEHPEWLIYLLKERSDVIELPPVKQKIEDIRFQFEHSKKNRAKTEYLSKYPQYKTLHSYSDCEEQFIFV